jgi:hypothetical protein
MVMSLLLGDSVSVGVLLDDGVCVDLIRVSLRGLREFDAQAAPISLSDEKSCHSAIDRLEKLSADAPTLIEIASQNFTNNLGVRPVGLFEILGLTRVL